VLVLQAFQEQVQELLQQAFLQLLQLQLFEGFLLHVLLL